MQRVYLEKLKPGMILAKTLFSPTGQVLLSEGVTLNDKYIDRLQDIGVPFVFIKSKFAGDVPLPDVVSDLTRMETQTAVKNNFNKLIKGDKINVFDISKQVGNLLDELVTNPSVVFELTHIQMHSENTFTHSVNVCVLSLLTGLSLGLNQLQLRDLGIGASLHDVGKTLLDTKILNKHKLNNEEKAEFAKHTNIGFEILRQYKELNLLAAHMSFQHHEHFDGTGYPRGLKNHEISQFARIVAYADIYDNLITDYSDRKGYKPWEALNKIKEKVGAELDPEIADAFFKHIIRYPAGCTVELKSGELGIVLRNNKNELTKPVVRIIIDHTKTPLAEPYDINLAEDNKYSIKKVRRDDDPNLPDIFKWNK